MEFTRRTLATYEEQRVTITEHITSGVIPWSYGRRGQVWRPESLRFNAGRHRFNGGPWGPWAAVSSITIGGVNVKADGSDGAERTETAQAWRTGASDPVAAQVRAIVSTLNAEWGGDALPPVAAESVESVDLDRAVVTSDDPPPR